jgi:pilus assembly protein Flp/PilA
MEFNMKKIVTAVHTFVADENGVTAIEYGLIAALVGVFIVGALKALGGQLEATFTAITTAMST